VIVMHRDPVQPKARRGQAASAGPAVEDHGRVVTANIEAAAFYRQAQQAPDASIWPASVATQSLCASSQNSDSAQDNWMGSMI